MQIIFEVKKVSVICIDAQPHNDGRVSITHNKEARSWGGQNSFIVCQLQKGRFGIIKTTLVSNADIKIQPALSIPRMVDNI